MNVRELRKALEGVPGETPVVVVSCGQDGADGWEDAVVTLQMAGRVEGRDGSPTTRPPITTAGSPRREPMTEWRANPILWARYHAIETESGRIGIVTCLRCGAAVLIDSDKAGSLHEEWHDRLVREGSR